MNSTNLMKQSNFYSSLIFCIFAFIAMPLNAELIDRGGGLVYDTDQDLTWTQDAGQFQGSWDNAMVWVSSRMFGGVSGWRLPITTQLDDPTCSGDVRVSINPGYPLIYEHRLGCLYGEMERLTALYDPWTNPIFFNVNRTRYWSATHYRDGTDPCVYYPDYDAPCTINTQVGGHVNFRWQWGFTGAGDIDVPYKTTLKKGNGRYAWAVHDGNVRQQGDINFDDQVNLADYLLLTQYVLGTRPAPAGSDPEINVGDMNLNSQLDTGDLVLLSRTIMGLI